MLSVFGGALIMAFAHAFSRMAHAEVHIEVQTDYVSVEVRDASVREALDALSTKFGLLVHNSAILDQPVSGTYQGSLQQVIARFLVGCDYVAKYSAGNIEIRILSPGNGSKSRSSDPSGASGVSNVVAPAQNIKPVVGKSRGPDL